MENSFFGTLLLGLWALWQQSCICRFLNACYEGICRVWHKSGIYHILFENDFRWSIQESIVYKVFASPFTFLNWLAEKNQFKGIHESMLLSYIREYLRHILALNTRFFGGFLVVFAIFYTAVVRGITVYSLIAVMLGFIGIILNWDGTSVLRNSLLVTWALKLIDCQIGELEEVPDNRFSIMYGAVAGGIAGILMFFISPFLALFIVAGFSVLFMMFYKPVYGLYLTVFITPFLPSKFILILCAIVALAVIVRNLLHKEHKWYLDDIGFLIMGLLAIYAVGVVVSFTRMSSFAIWLVYLIFIGFYIITTQLLNTKEIIFNTIKVFVIAATLVSIYGIMQYVFGWGVNENWIDPNVFATLTKRAYSTLENPNILGEYLILTIMAASALTVTRKDWWGRIGYGIATLLMLLCLMLTFSRGCWLGIVLAVAIFITFYNGKLWVLAIPVILVAPLILPENVITRFTSIGNMQDTSTAIRVKIWLSSLGMGRDFMLTGLGLGTGAYAFVYPFYAYYYIPAHHSHNAFFQVLIEGGIIGLLLFIAIMWRFLKHMTLCFKNNEKKDRQVALMVLAVGAGIAGFFVQGMFDYSFYNYRMVVVFWFFICLGTSLARVTRGEKAH